MTELERDWPRTECTSTDSPCSCAASIKPKIWEVTRSSWSNRIWFSESCQLKVKYVTPMFSQRLASWRPAQLTMRVTLFAKTNSRSCDERQTYLRGELVANEEPVLDLDGADGLVVGH